MLENAVLYARIILLALPFNVLQLLFQSFCVTAEKPRLGLTVTVMSGVTNMVMDAVLVMLLPQEYKLAGAAAATALSETVGGLVPLIYFGRENDSILRLGRCSFDEKAILKACTNGSSEFMSNISMSLVGMLYNIQLIRYAGEDGIAAYGDDVRQHDILRGVYRLLHRHGAHRRLSRRREELHGAESSAAQEPDNNRRVCRGDGRGGVHGSGVLRDLPHRQAEEVSLLSRGQGNGALLARAAVKCYTRWR